MKEKRKDENISKQPLDRNPLGCFTPITVAGVLALSLILLLL